MKRRKFWILPALLIFLTGLFSFCYPYLHRAAVDVRMKSAVQSYLEAMPESREPVTPAESFPNENPLRPTEFVPGQYPELWRAMQAYNRKLWEEKQAGFNSAESYEIPAFDLTDYGFPDDTFGIITIPKMDLQMPLYLGATYQHMADGAAQMSQTSLPIGGINTNCVIAGHRGWNGAPYFREILDLEPGDEVIIRNPWQTLRYRVSGIQIIAPNEPEALHIRDGRDLVTILTCHPYASGGKQRYLVFCDRVLEEKGK